MNKNPVVYIVSPGFTELSGGPMALHLLCHHLNGMGVESYLATDKISGELRTPILTESIFSAHRNANRPQIAVYPEILHDNRLNCEHVIRYLLNRPGQRPLYDQATIQGFWSALERQREFIVHYADEFRVPHIQSHPLWIPIGDEAMFNPGEVEECREGFLVYSHRVSVTPDMVPSWANPHLRVEMSSPRTALELSRLYRRSEALIVWERTGAIGEALMCGCPVVCVPSAAFSEPPMFSRLGNLGLGWGADHEQLAWAKRSLPAFLSCYHAHSRSTHVEVADMMENALRFFNLK